MASKTNTVDLSISDLADVLAALTEVTKPYQLGIQLKIDSSTLKTIEKNHPGDIGRQKTEVIEHWLCNSSDASWATLAIAVERMGGHSKLVEKLRSHPEQDHLLSLVSSDESEPEVLDTLYLPGSVVIAIKEPVHVPRNVLIVGKREHGKSTLGNRLLNSDRYFGINDQPSQTRSGSAMVASSSSNKTYKINVYDHNGLFEGFSLINTLSSNLPKELHLVIVVLKYGRSLDKNEEKIFKEVMSEWQIGGISALVLTHCERLSEEEREETIEQFKKDHPSITEVMGKGILAVGFPDSSLVQPGSLPLVSESMEEDEKKLRHLIYSCDEQVFIPWFTPLNKNRHPPQNENEQPLQDENWQDYCCSIL